jgi:hypothetical protein
MIVGLACDDWPTPRGLSLAEVAVIWQHFNRGNEALLCSSL